MALSCAGEDEYRVLNFCCRIKKAPLYGRLKGGGLFLFLEVLFYYYSVSVFIIIVSFFERVLLTNNVSIAQQLIFGMSKLHDKISMFN